MSALDEQIDQKTREAYEKTRNFNAQIDNVLSWVPEPLAYLIEPIAQGMKVMALGVDDLFKFCNEQIDNCGDEDRLRAVGVAWVTRVGDVLGDIAGDIGLEKFQAPIEWTGRAARAYQLTVPPQAAGLNAVKDIANQMQSSLNNLANAVESFKVAMLLALAGFAVAAVGAVAGAMTVVGAPAAVVAVTTAIGVSLAVFGSALVAMNSHVATIKTEQTTLQQKIHDLGKTWAVPNTGNMADASVADGDSSDWRPDS
ncbi:MAG: hypothetical protein ABIQ18_14670 [Umezawaea sp.]